VKITSISGTAAPIYRPVALQYCTCTCVRPTSHATCVYINMILTTVGLGHPRLQGCLGPLEGVAGISIVHTR